MFDDQIPTLNIHGATEKGKFYPIIKKRVFGQYSERNVAADIFNKTFH